MCNWFKCLLLIAAIGSNMMSHAQSRHDGIGRAAAAEEIAAWNIDVRPDFKGLPKGRGTVAEGEVLWEAKCASCHGVFGESNQVFNPIIGGTKKADIESGYVASLREEYPGRTTMMKLSYLSTLWDYIRRAMPWNAPKTLTVNEVYAASAYILHLADVLPAEGYLSDTNIAEVQNRLPNRKGMSTQHAMWPGDDFKGSFNHRQPDVQGSRCMKDCAREVRVASSIPEHARDAHGNLAEQNRLIGAQKGINTTTSSNQFASIIRDSTKVSGESMPKLLTQYSCIACHHVQQTLIGPSFKDIATKYHSKTDSLAYLTGKIRAGGSGVWGQMAMPAQGLNESEAATIAKWLLEQP